MKRFLLFSGEDYYPAGGWADFRGDFDTIEESRDHFIRIKRDKRIFIDWMHIVDTDSGKIVETIRLHKQ